MKKRRAQIFIDHDIMIRHFLLNDTFDDLKDKYDLQFVLPRGDVRVKYDVNSLGLDDLVCIDINRERVNKLRKLGQIGTARKCRKLAKKGYGGSEKLYKYMFGEDQFNSLCRQSKPFLFAIRKYKVLKKAGLCKEIMDVIEAFQPDVIIHPTVLAGVFIDDLAMISEKTRIPVVAIMNSWDNPAIKVQSITNPDHLFVWGEQSKKQAIKFMGMTPEKIKIVGAAQFDLYREDPDKRREDVFKEIGIDPEKKLIVYAGTSKGFNEIDHLLYFENIIESGDLNGCHILYRPHPWKAAVEGEPDFYEIAWKHVSMDPTMAEYYNSPNLKKSTINVTSYHDTHDILSSADLLVSTLSTIMLEAALHQKPVISLLTDEEAKKNTLIDFFLESPWLKDFFEVLKIPICKKVDDMSGLCRNALNNAASAGRIYDPEKLRYFVDQTGDKYSKKLFNAVEKILG
jgi:hypothetical protein